MPSALDLAEWIPTAAAACGFDLCGIAPAGAFAELQAFPAWIADGSHGEMAYLAALAESGELKRSALRHVAPWARSVIVCAVNYNSAQPYSTAYPDLARGWISRYAWTERDYHDVVLQRLRQLEEKIQSRVCADGHADRNANVKDPTASALPPTRCYVDTGPLVERIYAKYAGIGWIGKNTCIIHQQKGSWLFLGVILTTLELTPALPAADRCGSCTRCIEACPTDAIIAPYQLDARRCISYLTIEKRGDLTTGQTSNQTSNLTSNSELLTGMGRHVFGCDICQDVCPWNRKAPATTDPDFAPRAALINPALEWLAELSAEEFRDVFRGSPVKRAKRTGIRRNAVVAMGNSGEERFLPQLKKLADDEDPVVASHARWASQKLTEKLQTKES